MGLDITAYSNLKKVDPQPSEKDGDYRDDLVRIYNNEDFPGSAGSLEDRAFYSFEWSDSCLSMSYGGYNAWRDMLAKLAGYPLAKREGFGGAIIDSHAAAAWNGLVGPGAPFYDLINFSDCEGTIGPEACGRLLKDFVAFDEAAKAVAEKYFYAAYRDLWFGVELASNNGCLCFC